MNVLRSRRLRSAVALLAAAWVVLLCAAPSAVAKPNNAGHALIQGSGSSWAANAVLQWASDVSANGLQVVFSSNGSAQGRKDFANGTVDFAVSDIGYQGTDPATGQSDTSSRKYAYLPIVAGGTSFPYQIRQNGQLVRNLRLSGETLAKIFTNKITNWDDPEIKADNNGRVLPNLPIIPVVHSEGSGSTYQFTRYLATEYPSLWKPFAGVGATEYFPAPTGSAVAENGSDGLMNFLTSAAANGAIGYDEYSYALGKDYPVAKVLNSAGYYTLPTQYNVAVALTKAQINTDPSSPDYLLQNLNEVYTDSDERAYPISSYSYAIIPTASNDVTMTTPKRQTLADYLDYSVCQGQAEMGRIGYSPLPINLVQASFNQIDKLHTADKGVDVANEVVTSCHNPTFVAGHPSENYLAQVAPKPQSCDKQGAGPCTDDGNTGQLNPNQGGATTTKGGSGGSGTVSTGHSGSGAGTGGAGTSSGSGGSGTSGTTGSTGGTTSGTTGTGASGSTGSSQVGAALGTSGGTTTLGGSSSLTGEQTVLAASQSHNTDVVLGVIAALLVLGAIVVPAVVAVRTRRSQL